MLRWVLRKINLVSSKHWYLFTLGKYLTRHLSCLFVLAELWTLYMALWLLTKKLIYFHKHLTKHIVLYMTLWLLTALLVLCRLWRLGAFCASEPMGPQLSLAEGYSEAVKQHLQDEGANCQASQETCVEAGGPTTSVLIRLFFFPFRHS